MEIDLIGHPVRHGILTRDLDRVRVSITRFDVRSGRTRGHGDREYARARTDVEKTSTLVILLNRRETQTRCFVGPGTESHSRLDANHAVAVRILDVGPRWRDDEPPDLHRLPILFPLLEPIPLLNLAHVHLAHRRRRQLINPERLEELL